MSLQACSAGGSYHGWSDVYTGSDKIVTRVGWRYVGWKVAGAEVSSVALWKRKRCKECWIGSNTG